MEGGGEEGAPTASGGTSSTRTVGSEGQETDTVGGAVEKPRYSESDITRIIVDKVPIRLDDQQTWKPFADEVVVIVHAVNDNEYWAAVDHMRPPEGYSRCIQYKHGAALGTFGGYKAALVQTRMGHACYNEIERALVDFPNAQVIIAVGVAYASSKKCRFADVLVSTHIEDLVNLKFTKDDEIFTRGEKVEINQELVDTFCRQKDVWAIQESFSRTELDSIESRPTIHTGVVISTPWLIDNVRIKDKLLDQSPEAIGGEMEGGVLLRLQRKLFGQNPPRRIGVIVIKGVADYADGTEGKKWQLTAAMAAVGFASFQLERNGEFQLATGKPSTPDPQLGPMELFVESLMAEYERVSAASEEKLYPTPTANYTNLAVIKKEKVSRAKADKFTRTTLHGGLDEIMREKKPVSLEDVFKPDDSQQAVNFVLVEGAPGVGKSTFALELCRRWHSIELMKRFVAVVLLRLRERRVQKAKSVADLLYHEDDDIKEYVVKQVCSSSGKNLLLVLDGFDELPSRLQQSSFIADIIRGHWFRKATILVTSRPSARDSLLSLRPHPDKHIEVMGFTSVLVDQYANSVYGKDSQLLADFRTYINTNPAIKSMMYVPLNSAIVVEIYREYRTEGRPIPRTMTQLYTELTLLRIRSYLRDQCKQPLDSLPVKLEDLPKEFRDQLFSLAKLALNGCANKEVIFERLPVGCTCLGLMTASQEMYVGKKGAVNYNFFHLTHQEFLAAFYISHLTLAEKREIFLLCLQLDRYDRPEMSMSVVWRFVVGMVGLEDVGWDKYRPWLGRLVRSTLPNKKEEKEMYREVTPFLAQCLYEAQEKLNWGNLLETCVTFYATSESSLDCFAVGYCISASNWIWDLKLEIEPEMVEILVCGLKSWQEIKGSIKKLDLSTSFIGAEGVSHLQELPHQILQGISYLNLSACKLDSAAFDLLAYLVPTMTSMKELHISYNLPPERGGMVNILKSLSTVNTLQTLDIYGINLGPTDIMALSQLIRPSVGSVKKLQIGDRKMTQEHTEMMLEAVLGPTSLKSLQLEGVHLDLPLCEATLLQENHNLIKLTMYFCTPGTVSRISKGLHHLTRIRELYVNLEPPFNDDDVIAVSDDVIALSEMLRTSQSLKTMTVYAEFRVQDVQAFVSALQDNHTLEQLHLNHDAEQLPELPVELHVHVLDPRISLKNSYGCNLSAEPHPYIPSCVQ